MQCSKMGQASDMKLKPLLLLCITADQESGANQGDQRDLVKLQKRLVRLANENLKGRIVGDQVIPTLRSA